MVRRYTEEEKKLISIFEPWFENAHLRDDAPIEAVLAKEKFDEIDRKIDENYFGFQ
jgi:hypothetical protein|nr:MAG TPA: hypothetical protein [Caudoviricetes sp.]